MVKPRAKTDVPTSGGRWELSQESQMKPTANTEERHPSRDRGMVDEMERWELQWV